MTDGGDLRSQLEAALAENKSLKEQNQAFIVRDVATEFPLVSPDDLTGLSEDEARKRATELQGERTEQQRTLLKSAGLDDEAVEKVLAGEALEVSDPNSSLDPEVANLAKKQGGTGVVPPVVDKSRYFGPDAVKAHFREEAAKK